jgi:negative regulator of sigma E activity
MNDHALDELLSAYLDGELTPEEQSRVEHALGESGRCRQRHEEFLALRATLQSLPREQLDTRFSERVMERIRRLHASHPHEKVAVAEGIDGASQVEVVADAAAERRIERLSRALRSRPGALLAAAAAILIAVLIAFPRGGDPPVTERNGPNGNGEENVAPIDPPSAIANGADEDDDPANKQRSTEPPGDLHETPERDAPQAVAQSDDSDSLPRRDDDLSREKREPPQIARVNPPVEPRVDTPGEMAAAPPELVIDYGVDVEKTLFVFRLAVAPEALRSRVLDNILESEGLSLGAADAVPERPDPPRDDAAARKAPQLDVVMARAFPRDVDRVLLKLREREDEFRPIAVYPSSRIRFYEWVVAVAMNLPSQGARNPADLLDPANGRASTGSSALTDYLTLWSDPQVKAFAWRAPTADAKLVDRFFPVPDRPAPPDEPKGYEEVNPNLEFDLIFILVPQE